MLPAWRLLLEWQGQSWERFCRMISETPGPGLMEGGQRVWGGGSGPLGEEQLPEVCLACQ